MPSSVEINYFIVILFYYYCSRGRLANQGTNLGKVVMKAAGPPLMVIEARENVSASAFALNGWGGVVEGGGWSQYCTPRRIAGGSCA